MNFVVCGTVYFNYILYFKLVVMEMAAQALGRLAAAGGNHRTEYIEFQVRRAIEWLGGPRNEGRRLSAVSRIYSDALVLTS